MSLYLENGYANIPYVLSKGTTFNIMIGGRGTGKTFGALQTVRNTGVKFALMRRTQAQLDTIARPETSPFKAVDRISNDGWTCEPVSIGNNIYGFYHTETGEDGKPVTGELMGYGIALSTVANLRSFDMSDVDLIIYDEFIPETHEKKLKNESTAFFNAYETINRNRELQGKRPTQVLLLANANDFACPLLIGMKIVSTVERMIARGKTEYVNTDRSLAVYLLTDSPISTKKNETALYRMTHGTAFSEMAINNAFEGSKDPDVYGVNLREYNPNVIIGECCIYKHKSAQLYYVSSHESGSMGKFSGDGIDMKRFWATHRGLLMAAMTGKVIYESHLLKALFLRYCGFI